MFWPLQEASADEALDWALAVLQCFAVCLEIPSLPCSHLRVGGQLFRSPRRRCCRMWSLWGRMLTWLAPLAPLVCAAAGPAVSLQNPEGQDRNSPSGRFPAFMSCSRSSLRVVDSCRLGSLVGLFFLLAAVQSRA